MGELMTESTMMTKSKDMVFSPGPMAEDMRVNGKTESNMDKEYIQQIKMKQRRENGKMARESNREKAQINDTKLGPSLGHEYILNSLILFC